jgi:hypothetical protein
MEEKKRNPMWFDIAQLDLATCKSELQFKLETFRSIIRFGNRLTVLVAQHPEWKFWEIFVRKPKTPHSEEDFADIFDMFREIIHKEGIPELLIDYYLQVENVLWTIHWLEDIRIGVLEVERIAQHHLNTTNFMLYGRVRDRSPRHNYLGVRQIEAHAFGKIPAKVPTTIVEGYDPDMYLEDKIAQLEAQIKAG